LHIITNICVTFLRFSSSDTINKQAKSSNATHNVKYLVTHTPTIGMASLVSWPQHKTINKNTNDRVNTFYPCFPLSFLFVFRGIINYEVFKELLLGNQNHWISLRNFLFPCGTSLETRPKEIIIIKFCQGTINFLGQLHWGTSLGNFAKELLQRN
jgi:hypothetical protein